MQQFQRNASGQFSAPASLELSGDGSLGPPIPLVVATFRVDEGNPINRIWQQPRPGYEESTLLFANGGEKPQVEPVNRSSSSEETDTPSYLTPKGYVPVCVGVDGDTKRCLVHTTLLRHAEFLELLHKSAEEYGFCNESVLRIPYEAQDFEEHWMVKRSKAKIYKVEPVVCLIRNNRKDETITQKVCVCLSVGVDGDMKRFMAHTTLLRHTEFLELLHKSAEEYGFCNDSVLRIPYKALDFEEY
ncbi:hypothetical protein ACFX1T_046337 [Malus domestica]